MPSSARKREFANRMCLPVNQHRMMHGLDQALEQPFAAFEARAAFFEIFEQLVDGGAQLFERLRLALEADASRGARFSREPSDLLRNLADGPLLAPIPKHDHGNAHGEHD